MVVRYVIERFGQEALINILNDLARDVPINSALAKHTEPIEKLDENFDTWFKEQANALAKGVNWERPKLDLDAGSAELAAWNKDHPDAFWGLLGEGRALLAEKKFAEAKKPLARAIELYPAYGEAGGPYLLMAAVHRELKETADERKMLEKHLSLSSDAVEPRLRLMEIAAEAKDWAAVKAEAEAVLAINPLTPAPHRYLAQAASALGERSLAIEAHRTLLLLDPLDRATHHYAIAKMLFDEKQVPAARREVVLALEEAPRFRDAQKLLLDIVAKDKPVTRPATKPATPTPEVRPQ
jgi:tetratricopeptide (TPR) repeat protein